MNDRPPFPTPHAVRVDWEDPSLQALLGKTNGWQIDNRHSIRLESATAFVGPAATSGQPVTIAWEDGHKIVFLAGFPVLDGQRIRLQKRIADVTRIIRGEAIECRPGRRAGDEERGIHVVWARKIRTA